MSLLPRFWSDQNGLRIQVCGRLSDQADIHLTQLRPRRRDTARAGVVADYVERHAVDPSKLIEDGHRSTHAAAEHPTSPCWAK